MTEGDGAAVEPIAEFESRAVAWLESNLPPRHDTPADSIELQRTLFDGGFAGIAFPAEYGGAGLTLEHQKVFYDAAERLRCQVPQSSSLIVSIGMLGPTILDQGSHEAKQRFLPRLLRGDDIWMQLLSEPRGGSDMAGATTRLNRDGDTYVLSGSKMWSTGAHEADYGLCLCRSDWDVPKHRGLSMIAVPLQGTPGVTIERTRSADGQLGDFCQEFFDDVVLPIDNLIGDENDGWAVAQRLLFHERNAVANIGHGYLGWEAVSRRDAGDGNKGMAAVADLIRTLHQRGLTGDSGLRQRVVDVYIDQTVLPLTSARIMAGMRTGSHQGQWGSLLKLQGAVGGIGRQHAALAVAGPGGVIWDGDEVRTDNPGTSWLTARGGTLAGGSNEMQRNIITERLLGLPREPSSDRDTPFSEVMRRRASGS